MDDESGKERAAEEEPKTYRHLFGFSQTQDVKDDDFGLFEAAKLADLPEEKVELDEGGAVVGPQSESGEKKDYTGLAALHPKIEVSLRIDEARLMELARSFVRQGTDQEVAERWERIKTVAKIDFKRKARDRLRARNRRR